MPQCTARDYAFPPLPLDEWEGTKNALHLFLQIVGKIRLALHPKLNHWWHVPLYPSAPGFGTGRIPICGRELEIEFDLIDDQLCLRTSEGDTRRFPIQGLSVAQFYRLTMGELSSLAIEPRIVAHPYRIDSTIPFAEDAEHRLLDMGAVHRFWRIVNQSADIMDEFRSRFTGKASPVHLFWHSMDLAYTRFSGRPAPPRQPVDPVESEAYSHEVISFGFWAGDANFREPAYYSYTAPEPPDLIRQPLKPENAFWQPQRGAHMAILRYEDMRTGANPRQTLLDFLESAYQAGARTARWPVRDFAYAESV